MREKSFQVEFGKWLKANAEKVGSAAFELKSVKTSLPFSDVQEHQLMGLHHAKNYKLYMKIPDVGYQNPFDCFLLYKSAAFVVVRYGSGAWYAIDIDVFIKEKDTSSRKSLTEERAKEIATFAR